LLVYLVNICAVIAYYQCSVERHIRN